MQKIILATNSPYRQEAFKALGLDFISEGADVEERFGGRPKSPEELVRYLARLKAEAVARRHSQGIVIGFDSVGWFEGRVLEKVKTREEALLRLRMLSGKNYQFFTGIHMINLSSGKTLQKISKTEIFMRELTDSEISRYLDQDSRYTTFAHGYDPQIRYYSSTFIKRIEGSYNDVLTGIPLEEIVEMLKEIGLRI